MSVSYKKLWKLLIDKDMKKKDLEKAAGISNYDAVVLMGLFTFLFLGAEYLYVDVLSRIVSEDKTVLAQNYALGVSAAGFLLYPLFNRFCKERLKTICFLFIGLLSVLGIAFIGVGTGLYCDFHNRTCIIPASRLTRQRRVLCFHAYDENGQIFGEDCGYFVCTGNPAPICEQ